MPGLEDNQEMQHKHQFKLEVPEECMIPLNSYFLDLGLPMYPSLKKYENFSFHPAEEHLRKAYEYYKKTLQCIYYKGKAFLPFLTSNQVFYVKTNYIIIKSSTVFPFIKRCQQPATVWLGNYNCNGIH